MEVYYTLGNKLSGVISETMGHAPDMLKTFEGSVIISLNKVADNRIC